MQKLPVALVLSASFFAANASAQTAVPAGTVTSATWTAAGSPYVVAGTITIPSSETLDLEAGVVVTLAADADVVVEGSLLVRGTAAAPVRIDATDAAAPWGLLSGDFGAVISIRGATLDHFVAVSLAGGGSFRDSIIRGNIATTGAGLDFHDSEVRGTTSSTGIGTITAFHTLFLGDFTDSGEPSYLDHVTIHGRVTASATTTVFDSFIHARRTAFSAPRWELDHCLVETDGRPGETTVTVGAETNSLGREDGLVDSEYRPTTWSGLRFRDSAGGTAGAREYGGTPTASWRGWLWDSPTMTTANAGSITGTLTVPPGTTFTVEPGVPLTLPFGADELGYFFTVLGTLRIGDASGPGNLVEFTPTRSGTLELAADGPMAIIEITNATLDRAVPVVATNGATVRITHSTISSVLVYGELHLDGVRSADVRVVAARDSSLSNVDVRGAVHLDASSADVTATHCTFVGVGNDGDSGAGTLTIVNSAISATSGPAFVLRSGTSIDVRSSVLFGMPPAMGFTLGASVLTSDPMLDAVSHRPSTVSPCVDAADPASSLPIDRNEVPRPVDGDGDGTPVSDIGAYEIPAPSATCGNLVVEPGERCDEGMTPPYGWDHCAADCRGHGPYCGDLMVHIAEECDGTPECVACMLAPPMIDAGPPDEDASADIDAGTLADAGADVDAGPNDAGASVDGGPGRDGAITGDAARGDASSSPDAGTLAMAGGCGCRAGSSGRAPFAPLALGFLLALAARRRSARRVTRAARGC